MPILSLGQILIVSPAPPGATSLCGLGGSLLRFQPEVVIFDPPIFFEI
jgi:hypothetical protein